MTELQKWKEVLYCTKSIDLRHYPSQSRIIRKAASELRKEGIPYFPIGSYVYINKNYFPDQEEAYQRFKRQQEKAWATQYFNTILPTRKESKDDLMTELVGKLL